MSGKTGRLYLGAEIFQGESLYSVDTKLRIWLYGSKASRYYQQGHVLVKSLPAGLFLVLHPRIRTEKLFATAALLNNLNQSRLQLFNRRNMVGQNAHLAGLCRDVDLNAVWSSWSVSFYLCAWSLQQRTRRWI